MSSTGSLHDNGRAEDAPVVRRRHYRRRRSVHRQNRSGVASEQQQYTTMFDRTLSPGGGCRTRASRTRFTRRFYLTDPYSRVFPSYHHVLFSLCFIFYFYCPSRSRLSLSADGNAVKASDRAFARQRPPRTTTSPSCARVKSPRPVIMDDVSACYVLVDDMKLKRGENRVKCPKTCARDSVLIFSSKSS